MFFPSLHGNWVDFLIILFVVFYIWDGWGKGFISQMLDLVVFIGAFLLALKLYPFLANILVANFSFPQGIARAGGFFILGIVLEQVLANLAGWAMGKIHEKWHRHKLNRFLAVIPLAANAIVLIAFVLTLLLGLPIQGQIKAAISDSKLAKPLISKTQNLERILSKIFGQALGDSLNFVTVPTKLEGRDQVKLNFNQHELTVDEGSETEMLSRVNKERRDRGIKELVENDKLRDLARNYARDMFERGYFSHYNPEGESPFDRMEKAGITYQTAGENLALSPNVTVAHEGLMQSQGHRENILNPDFGRGGIGVIDGGIYGKMFVQEFTN